MKGGRLAGRGSNSGKQAELINWLDTKYLKSDFPSEQRQRQALAEPL